VSTGRSPETSGPSSPECTDPHVGDRRGATPPRTGVLRARLLRPAGRHAMVVAHSLNPASDAVTLGPSRERTANGRRSSAGQHRVHSCDRRKAWAGPRRLGPASRFPQREPALPRRQLESRVREAQVESSFWSGAGSQPSCGAGDRL